MRRAAKRVVTLTLPWPPSVNRMFTVSNKGFGKARKIHTDKTRAFYDEAVKSVMEQGKYGAGLMGRLALTLKLFPPNARKIDISNHVKAPEDALVKARVIDDDSLIDVLTVQRGEIVRGGKIVATVEELPRAFEAVEATA